MNLKSSSIAVIITMAASLMSVYSSAHAAEKSGGIDTDIARIRFFIARSGCPFIKSDFHGPVPAKAFWREVYFCKHKRTHLQAYVFRDQASAILFADTFIKTIKKEIKKHPTNSRPHQFHRYTVNGRLLFILRGDDEEYLSTLQSLFSGEE